jgi:hypothetical protein
VFISTEKPFLLPHYTEATARALATIVPTSLPRPHILGDPRVLNFINMSATKDFAITLSSSYSENQGSPNSCHSFSKSRFYSREVSVGQPSSFECNSSLSKHCSDGSTSQST